MFDYSSARLWQALVHLDAWFESMRCQDGYGGPVAHWWNNCLLFTGPGIDWRYEGIILGYLDIHKKTGDLLWLRKAQRAADDIIRNQLPTGNFYNSSFELNPYSGGTPHEAACDLALLTLANYMKGQDISGWETYALAAERNLKDYHLRKLWIDGIKGFGNSIDNPTFTPNKTCTIVEALFELSKINNDPRFLDQYAIPAMNTVLKHQITNKNHVLHGAIDQSSYNNSYSGRFFPYYIARCIPALVLCNEYTNSTSYMNSAIDAVNFIIKTRLEDGSFPQVLYSNGKINRYPRWIAACGDILRSLTIVADKTGLDFEISRSIEWIFSGQTALGGISTANGFASQISQRKPPVTPDFRDILCVCGWSDKSFRFFASVLPKQEKQDGSFVPSTGNEYDTDCLYHGKKMIFHEDANVIEVLHKNKLIYRHRKGSNWAEFSYGQVN